jgi:hypothetical protein
MSYCKSPVAIAPRQHMQVAPELGPICGVPGSARQLGDPISAQHSAGLVSVTTRSSLSGGELRNAPPYVAYRSVRIGHLRRRTRAGRVPRALRQATRNAPRSHRRNAQRGGREEVASIDIASLVDDGNWCAPAGSIREVIGRARGTPVRQAEYREGHDDRLSESLPQRGFGGAGFGGPGRRGGRAGFGTGGAGAVLRRAQPSTFCREARPFMQSPYALLSAAREELSAKFSSRSSNARRRIMRVTAAGVCLAGSVRSFLVAVRAAEKTFPDCA